MASGSYEFLRLFHSAELEHGKTARVVRCRPSRILSAAAMSTNA